MEAEPSQSAVEELNGFQWVRGGERGPQDGRALTKLLARKRRLRGRGLAQGPRGAAIRAGSSAEKYCKESASAQSRFLFCWHQAFKQSVCYFFEYTLPHFEILLFLRFGNEHCCRRLPPPRGKGGQNLASKRKDENGQSGNNSAGPEKKTAVHRFQSPKRQDLFLQHFF